jgi:hypothetical protein
LGALTGPNSAESVRGAWLIGGDRGAFAADGRRPEGASPAERREPAFA